MILDRLRSRVGRALINHAPMPLPNSAWKDTLEHLLRRHINFTYAAQSQVTACTTINSHTCFVVPTVAVEASRFGRLDHMYTHYLWIVQG